jgi:hypothetical protein
MEKGAQHSELSSFGRAIARRTQLLAELEPALASPRIRVFVQLLIVKVSEG